MVFGTVKRKARSTKSKAKSFAESQKLFLQENIPAERPTEQDVGEEFTEEFGDVFGIEESEEEVKLTEDDFL